MSDLISRQMMIDTEGLDEQIRCEMCRNPMHTDRGCDGNCKYDEKLYEKIMQILSEKIKPSPSAQPEPCEDDPRADVYYLAEKIGIHQLYALVVELRGEPEPCEDAVSREAAIDIFDDYNVSVENGDLEAYSRDRKRLCELPSAQPEPLTVTIDHAPTKDEYDRLKQAMRETPILLFPPAQPARKKAKWNFVGDQMFECTECGTCYTQSQFQQMKVLITDPDFPRFCPMCGADMRKDKKK